MSTVIQVILAQLEMGKGKRKAKSKLEQEKNDSAFASVKSEPSASALLDFILILLQLAQKSDR